MSDNAPEVISGAPWVIMFSGFVPGNHNVLRVDFVLGQTKGTLLPLFTGFKEAQEFLGATNQNGAAPYQLTGFDSLEAMLLDLQKNGVTHVNFNAHPNRPNPIPIAEVIASLKNRFSM
jgi:hypothetical protein